MVVDIVCAVPNEYGQPEKHRNNHQYWFGHHQQPPLGPLKLSVQERKRFMPKSSTARPRITSPGGT